jgi:uncharacterized protein
MEGIQLANKPKLHNPVLLCAWPGMGEVAFKAALYAIEKLKAAEFAQIDPEEFFYLTGSQIKDGLINAPELPYSKFYYYKNNAKPAAGTGSRKHAARDIVIFVSNAQPDLQRAGPYCQRILEVAKALKVKTIVSMAAMPQPVEHTQQPTVWYACTNAALKNQLQQYSVTTLLDGQISGMNGLFLSVAKKEGFEGFCLLGEIPLYTIQIENPKASYAVLDVFCRIFNVSLELKGLLEQAHAMEDEINKLLDYLKIGTPAGPIGEDDIEKIKKSLNQLTKLPGSVQDKIDKLFGLAKKDISKAGELKNELDRWNVYKEYEDRFLDLFKKTKDTSN